MNWIKAKKKSCKSESPASSVNRRGIRTTGILSWTFQERSHDRRFDLWPLLPTGRRQKRKGSLKQCACVLLKDEERVCVINRMADKRLTGFQNPVNPVILSKTQIEASQTCAAMKPVNATGFRP
jgi:hypothetical protein